MFEEDMNNNTVCTDNASSPVGTYPRAKRVGDLSRWANITRGK